MPKKLKLESLDCASCAYEIEEALKKEGSGDYIIYYPPMEALKFSRGVGKLPPNLCEGVKARMNRQLSTGEEALYAPPTFLILYVTRDGNLGIKSLTSSRVELDGKGILNPRKPPARAQQGQILP